MGLLALALLASSPALASSPQPDGASVTGGVSSTDGSPIPGASVAFHTHDGRVAEATTDASGRYHVLLPAGWVKAWASAQGFHGQGDSRNLSDGDAVMDFRLAAAESMTAILAGRVLDASGAPVRGASVSLEPRYYSSSGDPRPMAKSTDGMNTATSPVAPPCCGDMYHGGYLNTVTGEDGAYRFHAYGGEYRLVVRAEGFVANARDVTLVQGQSQEQDVSLQGAPRETVSLSGVVRDAETGLPVANAWVEVANLQYARWYGSVVTDAEGRYSVQVLPGHTRINVNAYRMEPYGATDAMARPGGFASEGASRNYYPASTYATLGDGEARTVDVRIVPRADPTIPLTGYVVDEQGDRAIPGVTVYVSNLATGEWGHAVTDASGSYRVLVSAGYLAVSTYAPGFFERTDYVTVAAGSALARHDLLLTRGEATPIDWYGGGCCYTMAPHAGPEPAVASDGTAGGTAGAKTGSAPPVMESALGRARGTAQQRAGNASFEGSGGGLPQWPGLAAAREQQAAGDGAAGRDDAPRTLAVPGAGALLAALGLAGAALGVARRRR